MQFFSLKNKRQHAGQKILQSEHGHKSSCVHTSFANYSPFSNHVSMIQSNKPGKIAKNHVALTSTALFVLYFNKLLMAYVCFVFPVQVRWCSKGNLPFVLFKRSIIIIYVHRTAFKWNSTLGYHGWSGRQSLLSKSVYGQLSFIGHLFNYMLCILGTSF